MSQVIEPPKRNNPMSGFFWNVRGLNKSLKHSIIRNWVNQSSMQFGCLLETRVKEGRSSQLLSSIFNGWSSLTNYESHRLGRIWVVWRENARLTPVFKSSQMITCSVLLEGKEEEFFCSFIYASNFVEERRILWEDIRSHHESPLFRNKPWILCGDFNEILEGGEHSNYDSSPFTPPGMRDFQEIVRLCSFIDLGYHGPRFTWCNKREEGLVCKKLDRFLVNDSWCSAYPHSYSVFETGGCSDHARGRLLLEAAAIGGRKPFKFVNVLTKLPQFMPVVENHWDNSDPLYVSTSALYRFSKKLKTLKPRLRELGKEKMGDLPRRTREAHALLCEKQSNTLASPSQQTIAEELSAFTDWQTLSELEEGFLKQKSKLHWMNVGDRNNAYFHKAAQVRKMQDSIREMRGPNNEMLQSSEEIKGEAERFFSEFLNRQPQNFQGMSVDDLRNLMSFRCSENEQHMLTKEVTQEEIHKVLFAMPNNKSPGPDGFTSEFFKATWAITGSDFTAAIQSFFVKGFLPKGLNATILALIPKKEEALEMKDYRPISCCNVL